MLEDLIQLHRAGRLDEAENGYRQLLAEQPEHAEVLHLLGILRGQRGDLPEALRLVRQASELAPDNAACQHTLGEMYLSEGQLDDAAKAYDQARRLNPNLATAHAGLGLVALQRGDADAAEGHFKVALRADENDVQALTGLGNVARIRGDSPRALQLFTQASELAPDDPLVQTGYAEALLDQGVVDFAAKAIDNALTARPSYPRAQVLRAELHVRKGELSAALAIYESLLARDEEVAAVRSGIADIARAGGRFEQAVAEYDEALRVQPGLHSAAIRRAEAVAAGGRQAQAIHDLRGHATSHPGNPLVHAALARLLVQAGRFDEAVAVCEEATARWPDDIDLKAQHALTLDRAGRGSEALVVAEAAATSTQPALVVLRARGALLAGDPAAAVQRLQRIDAQQFKGKPAQVMRRYQRLLGLSCDALEQWSDAIAAFLSAQQTVTSRLPELPPVDAALQARLQQLACEPDLGETRGSAPVLLCGLPGSGVGQVAALLADQSDWFVRRERFNAVPDFVNSAFDERLLQPLGQGDLGLLARRYRRPLERAGVSETTTVVDWLPVLDVRVLPTIKRALPGTRLVIVQRDPHDTLLNWLAFGWAEGFAVPDPLAGARWQRGAAAHLEAAASILPSFRVDPDALLAPTGADLRMRLGVFLGVVDLQPGAMARGAKVGHGGLPVSFPSGHASHYREVLAEPFATLAGG